MAGTDILDAVLTNGQNEGVERTVLPLPQLASIVNARQRKTGRWGKRYGTSTLSATDSGGSALGNGTGDRRCIGPGFCVVDDLVYCYDTVSATWVKPNSLINAVSGETIQPWVLGEASGWVPAASFFPSPAPTPQNQNTTPCSQAYFAGYLWTATQYQKAQSTGDYVVRVVATNPADNSLVSSYDVYPSGKTTGDGGVYYPRLVVCGANLIIVYAARLANAARGVRARPFVSLSAGFGTEVVLDTTISGSGNYDVCSQGSTSFAYVSVNGTATVTLKLFTASTLVASASTTYSAGAGLLGVTCSVVTASGQPIYFLIGEQAATSAIDLQVYNSTLTTQLSSTANNIATKAASIVPPTAYGALLSAGGVRVVFGDSTFPITVALETFLYADYTTTGTLVASSKLQQFRARALSRPFTLTSSGPDRVYIWTTNADISGYGFATMIRLASASEFGSLASVAAQAQVSAPVEMTLQDLLVENTLLGFANGLPSPVQIGTTATWSALLPVYPTLPDASHAQGISFRAVLATHYTDLAANRSVNPVASDGSQFVPLGALARVDTQGVTFAGYPMAPKLFGANPAAGGSLTASTTYQYVAIFTSLNAIGRTENSAVSAVLSVVLGAGQTQVTLNVADLALGDRLGSQVEIYRTLSNGSIFYRIAALDAFPNVAAPSPGFQSYLDQTADTAIAANRVLYTQVGQTLPNAPPPPSRFGIYGAQRIWLAGLFRKDVAQCTKLILGDQSPSFCDSDAFRVVAPAPLTGISYMDALMLFTNEGNGGVYIVTGDGPDDSGTGDFSPPQRLPYAIGCIEPRSVISVDEGTFFQSRRGLYMIPRGFGAPVPAGDSVMDTLASFPIITGVCVVTKSKEQTIRWTCVDAATPTAGRTIVYDLAHKCWSVDSHVAGIPYVACGQWYNGEAALAGPQVGGSSQVSTNSFYSDEGNPIAMSLLSGDLRPFGVISEGVISKVDAIAEVRSACTMQIAKITEYGTSPTGNRVFALAAGDYQIGAISYTETELGNAELRDVASLRVSWSESSTVEGLAFVAVAVEHEQGEGLKRVTPLSRTT